MHLYRQQSLTLYPQELEYHNYFGTIIKPIRVENSGTIDLLASQAGDGTLVEIIIW